MQFSESAAARGTLPTFCDFAASSAAISRASPEGEYMAIDPVCGMEVDEQASSIQASHGGKTFHFCSQECKERFQSNPEQYAEAA
jgi:P-type Cu+ transporter